MNRQELLKEYFGHEAFRPAQETVIDNILSGKDVLAIMPTGAGKSICYQIPALMLDGVTLVVSPLISLMRDQVMALVQNGVPAAYLNSSLTARQYAEVLRRARVGAYRMIYVAPERLMTESFLAFAAEVNIPMVTVDEAHCISQWGQDFRPSYLKITDFIAQLPKRPVISAFTATATNRVRKDIVHALRLRAPEITVTGFDRKNLYFEVQQPDSKDGAVLELVRQRKGESGIIYCLTRKNVEAVCELLRGHGIDAVRYHAGLDASERQLNQEEFLCDRKPVMVATNAFGMGIDKSNVSYVIHYNMPRDMESYYQEAGRAGRDGSAADCILLFSPQDIRINKFLINQGGDNPELSEQEAERLRRNDLDRLQHMIDYSKSKTCLRRSLLAYFGEELKKPCGNCSVCMPDYIDADLTVDSQKLLSCIYRVVRQGYQPGKELIYEILQGKESQTVTLLNLNALSTFGIMQDKSVEQLDEITQRLADCGYLSVTEGFCPMLFPTDKAKQLIKGKKRLTVRRPAPKAKRTRETGKVENTELFQELKKVRMTLANREGVPAFVICSDATLRDMCRMMPMNIKDFLKVSGIGTVKAEKYGTAFLEVIQRHR